MLYSPRRVAAAAGLSLLASIVLAGCSSGSNVTVTHNPPLSTFGGRSTARSAVQSAILLVDTSSGNAVPGGPTPAGIARRVMAMAAGRKPSVSSGACINGRRTSQNTLPDGSTTTTTDFYYDALCATLEEEEIVNIDSRATATTTGTGSITTYDRTTTVTSYHKLTLSSTNSSTSQTVVYNDAASATVGGTVIAAVGATCTGAPNSPTMTCSAAMYGTSGVGTFGQSMATTGTAGTGGAKNSVSVNVTFYGAGITGIGQSSGSWVVLGAAGFNSATGTYGYTTTGPTGSGTLSLTDALYTYTVTGNLTATGLAVTIVRNTDPIATATVNAAGDGAITYADGTSDVIWAGVVGV